MTAPDVDRELKDKLAYLATELFGPNARAEGKVNEYLLTGDGMLEIIEAMREQGFGSYTTYGSIVTFLPDLNIKAAIPSGHGNTLPEAVARAAYAALQEAGQ